MASYLLRSYMIMDVQYVQHASVQSMTLMTIIIIVINCKGIMNHEPT